MIKHIVAWNLKEEFSEQEKLAHSQKMKSELEALKELISELVSIEVSISPLKSSDRAVVLTCCFNSAEDLEAYIIHPEHKRVGVFVRSVVADRVCLDFVE